MQQTNDMNAAVTLNIGICGSSEMFGTMTLEKALARVAQFSGERGVNLSVEDFDGRCATIAKKYGPESPIKSGEYGLIVKL